MNMKKIVAAIAAAAVSVSMMAVNAFAATVTLNGEYTGDWSASATIPKAEFAAIGGDVKVVLTVETAPPLIGDANTLAKPMNICSSWDAITDSLLSDTAIAKNDGFFVIGPDQTTLEFVVPEAVWTSFVGYAEEEGDGSAGLAFQVKDVIIKSAELSAADAAQGAIKRVTEEQSGLMIKGATYEEATGAAEEAPAETAEEAPAEAAEEAPAADAETTSTATGNTAAAVMVSVMALAGAAAVASRKNK